MIAQNGLVLHVQVGNNSLYNYFNSPASKVSAHFWAAKSGLLEQYVDTDLVAWAEAAGNSYYLSVETEGYPNEPLDTAQLETCARLLSWVSATYNVPLTGPVAHGQRGFTPHCNPDGTPDPAWGNHVCPDSIRLNQMQSILALAKQPTPIPTPVEQEYEIMDSVVLADGTIVSHARTPNNHYLEITRSPGMQGRPATQGLSIIDITAQYPQYEVAG